MAKAINACVICNSPFEVLYKHRSRKTCGKKCSYVLRQQSRKTVYDSVKKICTTCYCEFDDTSKKKQVDRCQKCIYEGMVEARRQNGSYVRSDVQNAKLSVSLKKKHDNGWDPFTPEVRQILSDNMREVWSDGNTAERIRKTCLEKYGVEHWMKSDEGRQAMSKAMTQRNVSEATKLKMRVAQARRNIRDGAAGRYSNCMGGFREDIDVYVRSSWEANFARIMEHLGKKWQYEPETFVLASGYSYTPDFLVDDVYYEIKGQWTNDARKKVSEFVLSHSLIVVDGQAYNLLRKQYKKLIPTWEGK